LICRSDRARRWTDVALILVALLIVATVSHAADKPRTVESVYPGLTSGVLTHARLADLPRGVLLRCGPVKVTPTDITRKIDAAPETLRAQLRKNALFVLGQLAGKDLLLHAAKTQAKITGKTDDEIIRSYLDAAAKSVRVTEAEIVEFYEKNKAMCGGVPLARMKSTLRKFVLDEKRQKTVVEYVRTLGRRLPIEVSAAWLAKQVPLIRDNPVDKARASAKPSMVDFGSEGCRPCQMMEPILEKLTEKHKGKANILFVHVGKEKILAVRYGIRAIPVQVFFDKDGKEVFRHVGFFPQDEIEKKLKEIGVK